jgi:O-antigen ligase
MNTSQRFTLYVGGALLILFFIYQLDIANYSVTRILLIVSAVLGGEVVFIHPLLGIFAVLMLSPLKTLGSDVLLIARLAGLFTVAIVFLGLLIRRQKIRWSGIEGPVLLMGAGMALSFFRTMDTGEVFDTLLSLSSLYGLVLLIVNLIGNEKKLLILTLVYLVSGIYPIIQAFTQRAQGPSYAGQEFVRVSGTFSLATGLGGFLIPYTLIAMALMFYPGFSRLMRLFVIGLFSAGFAALIFTISRGAIAATFIGFGLLLFLLRRAHRSMTPFMAFLTAIIVIFVLWELWPSVQGRLVAPVSSFIRTGSSSNVTVLSRDQELKYLFNITLDNHFMGTGIGNYSRKADLYRVKYNAFALPSVPHNIFLYFFGEVGIIGAIGFLWLIVSMFRRVLLYYKIVMDKPASIVFYIYIGSVSALAGYSIFMITHSGLFTNEIWVSMAFLITSVHIGVAINDSQVIDDSNVNVLRRNSRAGLVVPRNLNASRLNSRRK